MIKKAKLNSCAHCSARENLEVVFSAPPVRRMYFLCPIHKMLLDALLREAEALARMAR